MLSIVEIITTLGDVYRFPAIGTEAVRSLLIQLELDHSTYENLVLTNVSKAVLIVKIRTVKSVLVDGAQRWPLPAG